MPSLTRITVNLRPRAQRAMERQAERAEISQTDVVNRALVLLDLLEPFEDKNNGGLVVHDPETGQTQRIYLL